MGAVIGSARTLIHNVHFRKHVAKALDTQIAP